MKLFRLTSFYGALAVLMAGCFGPSSTGEGACASAGVTVFAAWKQTRGYPSTWEYGGATPPNSQLANNFHLMVVERGNAMCATRIINQAADPDPALSTVFQAEYTHDVEKKQITIDYLYPADANTVTVTYRITGCNSKPILTLTYPNKAEAVFEMWGGQGSCNQQ